MALSLLISWEKSRGIPLGREVSASLVMIEGTQETEED